MTVGPGKYDHLCTVARESANADAALLMIVNGIYGSGFSAQLAMLPHGETVVVIEKIIGVLESTIQQIRDDLERLKAGTKPS